MIRIICLCAALLTATEALACTGGRFEPRHEAGIHEGEIDHALLDEALRIAVNQIRCKHGLRPLGSDRALVRAALVHSRDMASLGFFSHESPVASRRTPTDRLREAGARNRGAGENILYTPLFVFDGSYTIVDAGLCRFSSSATGVLVPRHSYRSFALEAMEIWMNSEGHRANILRPGYVRVGHGAAVKPTRHCGEIYLTQNFAM